MKFTICLLNHTNIPHQTLQTLQGSSHIEEILSIYPIENIPTKTISPSPNRAVVQNAMVQASQTDHLIWLDDKVLLDSDELFEEYAEIIEEESVDFIYPNLIIDGKTKNLNDWSKQKIELIQSFRLEEELPNVGIYTHRKKFNQFDPQMNFYALYDFLYKNLKNISIHLSELSFLEIEEKTQQNDTSYNSRTLREILEIYDFQNELFYHLDWKREEIAYATAYTLIGNRLMEYNDYYNAANFFRKALLFFHNQESLKNLVYAYYKMGLFDDAKRFLNEKNTNADLKKTFLEKIEKTEELIKKLENFIERNELDITLVPTIIESYDGAPIQNLIAAMYIYNNNLEQGYRHLYKAATQNPIDKQILENLATLAKHLKKEEEVMSLYNRLLH